MAAEQQTHGDSETLSRLLEIVQASADLIGTADRDGRLLYFNPAGRRLLEIGDEEDISSLTIADVHPERLRPVFLNEWLPTTVREGVWRVECPLLTRSGREVPVSLTAVAHKSADGAVAFFSAIARDDTVRKHAEEALREAKERLEAVVEASPVGIVSLDSRGNVRTWNSAAERIFGWRAQEVLGRPPPFIPPDKQEEHHALKARALRGEQVKAELRRERRGGIPIDVGIAVAPLHDAAGAVTGLIATIEDITDRKRFEERLGYLASHDQLTGLFNRQRFEDELERELIRARRYGTHGALLLMDLDRFKTINDALGHRAGDELLTGVADLLRHEVREIDLVARLGGDEFAVILPQTGPDQARGAAERILAAVRRHVSGPVRRPFKVTASLGIALFPEHARTVGQLLARADLAMYSAKESGRDNLSVYQPDRRWQARAQSGIRWETRIREALEKDTLAFELQPIVDLRSREVCQYEVLARLPGEKGELVPASAFIGIAEELGLIHAIDRRVVRHAIHLMAEQQRAGRDVHLSVNLSAKSFSDSELLSLMRKELTVAGVDPFRLTLEVTETAAISDMGQARRFIGALKDLGCRFALDDFGVGFASFDHLKQLPVDYLKIDGSFISQVRNSAVDQHLVKAMTEVAHALSKRTIAEFVGDEETARLLQEYGVDLGQGYYLGRPQPVSSVWGSDVPAEKTDSSRRTRRAAS